MAGGNKTVLIADDSLFMRAQLAGIFRKAGFEVVAEVSDGEQALSAYREHRPAIVTLDIVMPKVDGIETLRQILEFDPEARVIMVSSLGLREKVIDCVKKGARSFIVKPFEERGVLGVIARISA